MERYKKLSPKEIKRFQSLIWDYYAQNKRAFSWRETHDPYYIVVSEIMLQQTQTDRVKAKYEQFIGEFPTVAALAKAPLSAVISAWQGLGYNRRAIALHLFAQRVCSEFKGVVPNEPAVLETFKGIGPATAASICAFAFNKPTVFIETNVRAVYIHTFFPQATAVKDSDIIPLVAATVDSNNARNWYYALMDYGVMLKKEHKNPSRKSAHHAVQSKFEGSDRQVRGMVLKLLVAHGRLPKELFFESISRPQEKIVQILGDLEREGFIRVAGELFSLVQK